VGRRLGLVLWLWLSSLATFTSLVSVVFHFAKAAFRAPVFEIASLAGKEHVPALWAFESSISTILLALLASKGRRLH
jgi:hypothetical protein